MSERRWTRALVTGATSGIGAAMTEQLAALGVELVVVARPSSTRLDDVAAKYKAPALGADLATGEGIALVAARLASDDDPIDLIVNNAGVGTAGRFVDAERDVQAGMVSLNVIAPTLLAQAAGAAMSRRGTGTILTTASFGGLQPMPYMATYAAGKAFLTSLCESLSIELKGTGVSVTALLPGLTRTPFVEAEDFAGTRFHNIFWLAPERVAREGLAAAAKGRTLCVPGTVYKGAAVTMNRLPHVVKRVLAGELFRRFGPPGS